MSVATLANITVQLERATEAVDAMGGLVRTWAVEGSYRMRIQPLSAADSIRHSKDETMIVAKGYIDGTPAILEGDRLRVRLRPNTVEYDYFYVEGVRNIDVWNRFTTLELAKRDQSG